MSTTTPWTTDTVSQLKEWWENGLTSSEIAHRFQQQGYNITRNSVIGKAHRLGFCHNSVQNPKAVASSGKRAGPIIVPKTSTFRLAARPIIRRKPVRRDKARVSFSRGKTMNGDHRPAPPKHTPLSEIKDGECKAIIGYKDNILAKAICCGAETGWIVKHGLARRSPWCEHHRMIYTVEATSR